MTTEAHTAGTVLGIIGTIISFAVFLAPLPTFIKIFKRKSSEGFQSLPYVVALFSAMLWNYYAFIKRKDVLLLIICNSFGFVVELAYIVVFLIYATKQTRLLTVTLLVLLNVFGFGAIVLSTMYLSKGAKRLAIVGWICLVLNISVFAAPLFIISRVIRTKSVEYLPFTLSFFLTINAVMWFFYGFLLKDYYVALPNTLGFVLGLIQMAIYMIYRNATPVALAPTRGQELSTAGGLIV